ncbi:hypothetical protein GCM10022225_01860 [Plantactinospora mayteni]|uniref:Pyrroloquinoline-quinone binding quinoprotein n=1 Tax=Plantactinospora mayteni TaxID=566021 RepID=A0ABQ4EPV6_9ACTN|nr:hypothetical protein [Plantactinospora mayteni]GIG96674.1 hypothetical protein Pma05_32470 [Plantactinospora mayteni]
MSAREIRLDRVLGAGPFREIGQPRAVATTSDGALFVVGGDLGWPQWHGRDVSARSRPRQGWYPVAVYRSDDLTCLHHIATRWRTNVIACHPTLPLAAIGTGAYDGGWAYEGELLLLDLTTGGTVSLLAHSREVRQLTWRDPHTLDLVLAIPCDEDEARFGSTSLACTIRRDDWDRATSGMLRMPYGEVPVPDAPRTDPAVAVGIVEGLCRERGLRWAPRREVWAVDALSDDRVVAVLEGVRLECWSVSSAETLWRIPVDGTGCQLKVLPEGRTALALTQTPSTFHGGRWTADPSVVAEVDLADGVVRALHESARCAVLVSRADGWWALRDTEHDRRAAAGQILLNPPDGGPGTTVGLGRYDLFNHFFDIRYAPDLLFLEGGAAEHWQDKWVVSVDVPDGPMRRLFPLEWDASRGRHLFGGCGAYLDDRAGPSLVHTGAVHDGAGLLPGNAFVVRRAYPTGELQWVFPADHQATALDADGDFVYVTFNSGELVILRAADGTVHARQELRVDGHPVVPLSLVRLSPDRLAIGTLDGRILVCSLAALPDLASDQE